MTPQVNIIKRLSVKDTLMAIKPGNEVKFKYGDISFMSVRAVAYSLNKEGYGFHLSAISGNDYFTVRRDL